MWNGTVFSEKRSKSRSQRSVQKYQYFEWGSTLNLDRFKIIIFQYIMCEPFRYWKEGLTKLNVNLWEIRWKFKCRRSMSYTPLQNTPRVSQHSATIRWRRKGLLWNGSAEGQFWTLVFHANEVILTYTDGYKEGGILDFLCNLRGYCTPNQKLACFVLYLKIINTFLKIIYPIL